MTLRLLLFEDSGWRGLRPLTDLASTSALAFGASTLGERWRRRLGFDPLAEETRAGLEPPGPSRALPDSADELLAINAAALPGPWIDRVLTVSTPAVFRHGGRIVAARLSHRAAVPGIGRGVEFAAFLDGLGLVSHAAEARVVVHPWHLIEWNAAAIAEDLAGSTAERRGEVHPQAVLLEASRISIAPGARIDPLAVLDAREGPIRIEAEAQVRSHSVVTGPCVIGAGTQILGGAVGRSTIGPQCRIAGEVEESVWQGYANKRHHGFVGHSVIGEWVNLGALTTTSDLKNNYGSVRVWVDGREVDSGSSKVGALIGSHVKTGIGTLLPTGAAVGVGSNLFGGGRFAPKHLPAFSWWDGERTEVHRLEPFLATARIAAGRRGRTLDARAESALRELFETTAGERASGPGSSHRSEVAGRRTA